MMQNPDPVREHDLHAYFDGQLSDERAAHVEAWLAEHAEDAEKVRDWQQQNEAINALYGGVASEPVPDYLLPESLHRTPDWRQLAAAIMLLVLGGGLGWLGHGQFGGKNPQQLARATSFLTRAVVAHNVYAVEVRHPVEVAASEEQHLVAWLSKRLAHKIRTPDLQAKGFALVGGRLLPGDNGAAAQFMYEDDSGRRLTLYITRNRGKELASFRFAASDGVNAFYWLEPKLGYALIGTLPRAELLPLVRDIYAQLDE